MRSSAARNNTSLGALYTMLAIVTAGASSLGLLGLVGLRAIHDRQERGELTYWVVATAVLALTSVVLAIALRAIGRAQAQAFDAERERWSLQEQLLRSQRLETVAKLAAGVAHDFNNFLNVIIGQAGLLARHPDEKASAQAQQIESAAWRAADLTQKLLAVGQNRARCRNDDPVPASRYSADAFAISTARA